MTPKEIHSNYLRLKNEDKRDIGIDPEAFGKKCYEEGFRQISHKYRRVARLPEGMNGIQAMTMAMPDFLQRYKWPEESAADYFRRCYAERFGLVFELTLSQFAAFKKVERESRGW